MKPLAIFLAHLNKYKRNKGSSEYTIHYFFTISSRATKRVMKLKHRGPLVGQLLLTPKVGGLNPGKRDNFIQ